MTAPTTPPAISRSHGQPPIGIGGAEFGRRHGLQPVWARLPADADVPAAICLSDVPSRIVTMPATVSTCVCEHSTSTRKLFSWPESAITVASLVVTVVATPAAFETFAFPEERIATIL